MRVCPNKIHYIATMVKIIIFDTDIEYEYEESTQIFIIVKRAYPDNYKNIFAVLLNDTLYSPCAGLPSMECTMKPITFDDNMGKQLFWYSSIYMLKYCCYMIKNYKIQVVDYGIGKNDFYIDIKIDKEFPIKKICDLDTIKMTHDSGSIVRDIIKKILASAAKRKISVDTYLFTKHEIVTLNQLDDASMKKINDSPANEFNICKIGDYYQLCEMCSGIEKTILWNMNMINDLICNISSIDNSCHRLVAATFPSQSHKKIWQDNKTLSEKVDHRFIGNSQKLFFYSEYSPGSCFFYPHGTIIYNKLVNFIKTEYKKRNFQEVITPTIFSCKLWQESGHWNFYKDEMFQIADTNENLSLKPMNCPSHCVIYKSLFRTCRELPLRYADFGILYGNELSDTSTRVRQFCQDDAHIFCTQDQITTEIKNCLNFVLYVYSKFNFNFTLKLTTIPKESIGDDDIWTNAESQLISVLDEHGLPYELNFGDDAHHGPKIDIMSRDSLNHNHHGATIQLDFNLPKRFELLYQDQDNILKVPIMIHCAIFGSIERFVTILTEAYEGKWPFWLSPRQILIITINQSHTIYARNILKLYQENNFDVELDDSDDYIKNKIKKSQTFNFNFIAVIGDRELAQNKVNIRNRNGEILGEYTCDASINFFNSQN